MPVIDFRANNMLSKVYLETTMISYLAARRSKDLITAAHQQLTHDWWDNRRASFDLFISQLVVQESSAGDAAMAQSRLQLLSGIPLLVVNQACVSLGRSLVERANPAEGSRGRVAHSHRDCSRNGLSANVEL